MSDTKTPQQRHKNMSAIHSKDTKPEMVVRRGLWRMGFRYRLNHKRLPGHPDLVLTKYRTCIFVNGCFWHGHNVALPQMDNGHFSEQREPSCLHVWPSRDEIGRSQRMIENSACCKIPQTNTEFWVKKIVRNQERDREVKHKLNQMGWNCITVWECELKPAKREETLKSLAFTLNEIFLNRYRIRPYGEQEPQKNMAAEPV